LPQNNQHNHSKQMIPDFYIFSLGN